MVGHYSALATLFRVREIILDLLDQFSPEAGIEHLYERCSSDDGMYFCTMVHDLLMCETSRCAFDVASRYQSIVGVLLMHCESPDDELSISLREFTSDSLVEPDMPALTQRYIQRELPDIQIELFELKLLYQQEGDKTPDERSKIAIELVRIHEILHLFFGYIYEESPEEASITEVITEMNDAFCENTRRIGGIVRTVVDTGSCSEALSFLDCLMDFTKRIGEFFEKGDYRIFRGPYIGLGISDFSAQGNPDKNIFLPN